MTNASPYLIPYAGSVAAPQRRVIAPPLPPATGACISDALARSFGRLTAPVILAAACDYWRLIPPLLTRPCRTEDMVLKRALVMTMMRERCKDARGNPLSFQSIGKLFGGRDHATVICAIKKYATRRSEFESDEHAIFSLLEQEIEK